MSRSEKSIRSSPEQPVNIPWNVCTLAVDALDRSSSVKDLHPWNARERSVAEVVSNVDTSRVASEAQL